MAIGMTKLQAVNESLEACGEPPVPAIGLTDASLGQRAEDCLDRIDRRIQMMGWPENTDYGVTIASAAPTIVASDTLWIGACAPNRNLTLRGNVVYDIDAGASVSGSTVLVNKIKQLSFEDLAPRTKELISCAAAAVFQKRYRGSPQQAAWMVEEQIVQDIVADRIASGRMQKPINPYPIIRQQAAQPGQ